MRPQQDQNRAERIEQEVAEQDDDDREQGERAENRADDTANVRDRCRSQRLHDPSGAQHVGQLCLLYTSDAADE